MNSLVKIYPETAQLEKQTTDEVVEMPHNLKTSPQSDQLTQPVSDSNPNSKKTLLLTSTVGVIKVLAPNVISGSVLLGLLWTVLYVFFLSVLAAQTWMMVSDFASHPVTVSISIRSDTFSAQFPTVTLCNNNIARASMLQRVSRYEDLVFLDSYIANNLDIVYNSPKPETSSLNLTTEKAKDLVSDLQEYRNESSKRNETGGDTNLTSKENTGTSSLPFPDNSTMKSDDENKEDNQGGSGTGGGGEQGQGERAIVCTNRQFQCNSSLCIPDRWVCNGRSECGDGSDEEPNRNCSGSDANATSTTCIDGYIKCPGEATCAVECDGIRECVVDSTFDERESPKCPDSCIRTINVTARLEYLTSPGYPEEYPMKLQCEYDLIAPEGEHIELKFEHFEVEEQTHCQFDYMKIRDGRSKTDPWFIIKEDNVFTCGTLEKGLTFYSTSNLLKIYFDSDSIESAPGWNISFRAFRSLSRQQSEAELSRITRSVNDNLNQSTNLSPSDVSFYRQITNYESRDRFDWYGAFKESVMPDFSDFKQLLSLKADEIIGNGHQAQDFIIQCVFDGMLCSYRHFKTIQTKQESCSILTLYKMRFSNEACMFFLSPWRVKIVDLAMSILVGLFLVIIKGKFSREKRSESQ